MSSLKFQREKEQKGITLIALVVTIIVLIILVGVSINMLVGENGIINMAQRAKNETEQAAKDEQQALASVLERNYVTYNGQLHVEGKDLVNQYGEKIQLRGTNILGTYNNDVYDEQVVEALKDWGINVVRIPYDVRWLNVDEKNTEIYMNMIDWCIKADLYVVVLFLNEGNPNEHSQEAVDFFTMINERYKDYPNIIYEINNEAIDGVEWSDIKDYANHLIPEIRKLAPNSVIISGTPLWDSDITAVIDNQLEYENIMYAYHIYTRDMNEGAMRNLNTAYYNDIPIFVTEWSAGNSSGTTVDFEQADRILKIMEQNNISWKISANMI